MGAFSTVLLLASIGFFVHVYFSFREREQQFAVLRSIGLSTRQLAAIVWLEQAVQVLGGMALGTWMGVRLVSAVMPFMGHDETGGQVVPPFAVQVDWTSLALAYAVIAIIFGVIMGGVTWTVHRSRRPPRPANRGHLAPSCPPQTCPVITPHAPTPSFPRGPAPEVGGGNPSPALGL